MWYCALMRYYQPFPAAIPLYEAGYPRVTHPSATNFEKQALHRPFDLHVLSTPPAFILSQDQTLNKMVSKEPRLFKSLYWSSFQLQRNLTVVLQAQACLNNQIQIWCFVFSLRCLIYKVHAVHRRVLILPHSNLFVKNFFQILFNLFLRGPLAFQRRF